ncbi:hypothetical protein ACH5RR_037202 [Cinchona calisaya]|uniref:Aminotransferase-like plant mobile domain-containing protein n=1 Tax=Cinchona calisaya TaxID=153742 RepID=A0ABD2Y5I2_9GENT
MPYTVEIMARLPAYCIARHHIWRSQCPLVCWEIVENHMPHRVMSQFGLQQNILELIDTEVRLHSITRVGHVDADWNSRHIQYLTRWASREALVVDGDLLHGPPSHTMEYLHWFRTRTVLYFRNPIVPPSEADGFHDRSEGYKYMANVLTRIVYMTMNVLPEHEAKIINGVRHIAMGALEHLGQQRRIEMGPVELPLDVPFTYNILVNDLSRLRRDDDQHDVADDVAGMVLLTSLMMIIMEMTVHHSLPL